MSLTLSKWCQNIAENKSTMNWDWFIGFVEGEGCFNVSFGIRYSHVYPRASLVIGQQDRIVLDRIKEFLHCSGIHSTLYDSKSLYENLRKKVNEPLMYYRLIIYKTSSIRKLIDLLDSRPWQSEKFQSFLVWKNCVKLMSYPYGKEKFIKIAELSMSLNSNKGRRRKWTPEYVSKHCFSSQGKVKFVEGS